MIFPAHEPYTSVVLVDRAVLSGNRFSVVCPLFVYCEPAWTSRLDISVLYRRHIGRSTVVAALSRDS